MSGWLLNLSKRLLKPFSESTSAVQGKVDLYRAAIALKYYVRYDETKKDPVQKEIDSFYGEVEKFNASQLNTFVQSGITAQVIKLFQHYDAQEKAKGNNVIDKTRGEEEEKNPFGFTLPFPFPSSSTLSSESSSAASSSASSSSSSSSLSTLSSSLSSSLAAAAAGAAPSMNHSMDQEVKFSLVCRKSSIAENAGEGVFIHLNTLNTVNDSPIDTKGIKGIKQTKSKAKDSIHDNEGNVHDSMVDGSMVHDSIDDNIEDSINTIHTDDSTDGSIDGSTNECMDDSIVPGSVVCLYPGLVHLKHHLKSNDYLTSLLPDPDFMLTARIDQTMIDGRTAHLTPYNPYALAHKINHCGKEGPNVIQIAYDYPEDPLGKEAFPKHLRKYIPNEYAYQVMNSDGKDKLPIPFFHTLEKMQSTCMKGVVFVACRHINDGDELLLDYRLYSPDAAKLALPPWYTSYSEEEARMRWTEDD